jgi:hypothetical protein
VTSERETNGSSKESQQLGGSPEKGKVGPSHSRRYEWHAWAICIAACIQALATVAIVGITWQYTAFTGRQAEQQAEPQIEAGLNGLTLSLSNRGVDPVVDVSVHLARLIFLGPPQNT